MAVSPHHHASAAAVTTMNRGGNAVDGAIAANAVLGVVLPDTCGIGGDLFALVHLPGVTTPATLNASGRAGSGVSAARLREAGCTEMPYRGPDSVTVPGCIDGWEALVDRFGRLSLAEVLEPAIGIAEHGFDVSDELAQSLHAIRRLIGGQAAARNLYPDGRNPAAGASLRRPDLAATLRDVAEHGREAFYNGAPGRGIVAATDGLIQPDDLARRQFEWVDPASLELFGRTAWTIPPNSQGYVTLASLFVAERLEPPRDLEDPDYHHVLIEAYRSIAWERNDMVADPDFAPMAIDALLDPGRLAERAGRVRRDASVPWPAPGPAPGGTAYLATIDDQGMGVSLIQSNFAGIGSGLAAGDTGVFLHNRGAGFTLQPGHPNELAAGKRPLHTLSPTLWTRSGQLDLLLGTRGGHHQPQLLLQAAAHRLYLDLPLPDVQDVPRWALDPTTSRSALTIEAGLPDAALTGLAERGHSVTTTAAQAGWGPISMIEVGPDSVTAAADPRVTTAAAAGGS